MDKSLLVRAETSVVSTCPLYYMLDTVRAYAARELTASGARDDAMEGLVRYSTGEAALAAEGLVGPAQVEWLGRVREDLESYRCALAWLIERGRPAEASDIACGLMFFWMIRGHAAEGLRWYEQILNLPLLPPAAESRARLGAAAMVYTRGDLGRARTELTGALRLAHDVGDMNILAQTEDLLGHVDHAVGNLDVARDRFTRSVGLFRDLAIPWGTGDALSGLAGVALATGHVSEAERLLDEAALTLRRAGPWFLLLTLYVRAILALRRGSPDEAIALARESLTRIRELHDKFAFVYVMVPLAAAAALKGADGWVARILGARDAVTERTGATVVDKSVDDLRERAERDARARLGPDRWAKAYAAGRNTSIDALLKDIDSPGGQTA
jgi:tetratricopeptide (TPR) repeat protein